MLLKECGGDFDDNNDEAFNDDDDDDAPMSSLRVFFRSVSFSSE